MVADHDHQGRAIWAGEGKSAATLNAFSDELGDERVGKLEAINLDMGKAFKKATDEKAPTSVSAWTCSIWGSSSGG